MSWSPDGRSGLLRDPARPCEANTRTQPKDRSRLGALLHRRKEVWRGQQVLIDRLEVRLQGLEADNAALGSEQQPSKAERQLQKELVALQQTLDAEVERRRQHARNNRSLGGRVVQTDRCRRQRDHLQEAVELRTVQAASRRQAWQRRHNSVRRNVSRLRSRRLRR